MYDNIASIEKAIKRAVANGILVFAAAANHGANGEIAFPARMSCVFCIGAADGEGVPAGFNPPYREVEKYSTLGIAVNGAISGTKNGYERRQGTSTATPIAAGIAALFLESLREIDNVDTSIIRRTMRNLFRAMSPATTRETYRYLSPWTLIKHKSLQEAIEHINEHPPGIIPLYTVAN
jgi:Subtilase family